MNRVLVDRVADAVLYEGYILYPYRPSVKNQQRWTFGGLYPEVYCRAHSEEASANQTEVLLRGTAATSIEAVVRFLHLTQRLVGAMNPPPFRPVETLRVGEQVFHSWQEAEEREVAVEEVTLGELTSRARHVPLSFPGGRRSEPIHEPDREVAGVLIRVQQMIAGTIEIRAVEVAEGLFRLTLRVENRTTASGVSSAPREQSRDEALLCSLVSAHTILGVRDGEFVSLIDPPDDCRQAAADCRNVGVWPVLVGAEGQTDTMLASPIILYDYPQLAPESPGEFFDSTEIDEMLTLRILTLTDDEKRAMAAVDERARALLERTEMLARQPVLQLHGTIRGVRSLPEGDAHG